MFPSFIGILDIQSWWEVPCIAHFCSLFRAAFNLLDFDIEELEEALLTDGTEESASSLLTELIVRLLCGCLGNNDISAFNYQMFLRRLFRQKCQETGRYNPFNTDIDFQFLPLRTKVEILFALCDFRLDADDVFELFKNLEAESLRVEPLGWDSNSSAYWYFYGTRLYREDYKVKPKGKKRKKVDKKSSKSEELEDDTERVWQVVCFTESDWINLTEKFKGSASKLERDLYQSLSENFLPEIPRLFQEKERLQRKRLLELAPRRTSSRVQIKQKQKEEEESKVSQDIRDIREKNNIEIQIQQHKKKTDSLERESRVRRREKLRTQSDLSSSSDSSHSGTEDSNQEMWPKRKKRKLKTRESSLAASPSTTMTSAPKPTGRQTNNSLACATGQIVIPDIREPVNPTRKKVKSSQIYELLDQDLVVDMYKVLEQLKSHDDAWPFMDPVEEDYAPNYYTVIRRPMDLKRMEDRLDEGFYTDFSMFKNDFKLIVNNCRLYNGQESEYTKMVNNLEGAFNKLTQRYFEGESSSDDEIAIEYPIQNPYPRKQSVNKRSYKNSTKNDFEENQIEEDEVRIRSPEKRKSNENYDEEEDEEDPKKSKKSKSTSDEKSSPEKKERSKSKSSHLKKKKKLKRLQEARKSRKDKHKKTKDRKKHSKRSAGQKREKRGRRALSEKFRSRSNSRSSQVNEDRPVAIKRHSSPEIDFYKDKFDKIKERRRGCVKKTEDYSLHNKHKDKKSNLSVPEKDKHLNLKETIEKLKAKSETQPKPQPIYNDLYEAENINPIKKEKKFVDSSFPSADVKKKSADEYEFVDDDDLCKDDPAKMQVNIKNESAREALEQAMKDINKWLDDTPKLSEFGSNSNSPLQIPITDEFNISPVIKQDDETSNSQPEKEKTGTSKKDGIKKRQNNKDPAKTVTKKKEVQRTIDRLQPGKSKGNLITNIQTTTKQEENVIVPIVKAKDMKNALIMKAEEGSPKLSLGTVLPTVGFGLGKQHNFTAEQSAASNAVKVEVVDMGTMTGEHEEPPAAEPSPEVSAVEEPEVVKEKEVEPAKPDEVMKQCQEKATPNLSAWFKAFGAPKSVAPSTPLSKKKTDDYEQDDSKINTSPLDSVKNEQGDDLLGADGSESPIGNLGSVIRARRTSTGSSISERSSFSQDLDSPRHQPSHPSPLLRSPASPRTEEVQKTYPLMNVTVRVGFYQDTTSVKSSPEKSCSPREAPQSPYANYSQHVYASSANGNNNSNNQALTYPAEGSNKSPIPAYAQSPYYENVKANASKPNQEDFTVYSSDNAYQQPSSPFTGPFSPAKSPYSHHSQHSPYSLVQSPQTSGPATPAAGGNVIQPVDRRPVSDKPSAFPVKKRSYDIPTDTNEDESCLQIRQQTSPADSNSPKPASAQPTDEAFNNNPEVVNNPSVITSTLTKSGNIGYPYDTSRDLSKQTKEDFQNKGLLPQYSDYASDYSLKKSQVNDYSLAGLSKVHSEGNATPNVFLDSQLQQQSMFNELKNISKGFSHDYTMKDKQVDMVNMGYSSKLFESMKGKDPNVDLVNMGYMQSEAHSHLSKLQPNADDLRNISSYYNPASSLSYPSRLEQNTQMAKVTAANDYMELNKRYGYTEKSNSVLQYMKSSEMNPSHNPDILQLNQSLLRSDGNKQGGADNSDAFARGTTDQMYKEWMKKNQDAHNLSLYKDSQSKADNKMSVSQMATSAISNVGGRTSDTPTYDTGNNTGSPEEGVHKNQAELRVHPGSGVHFIRAVIKISSSIKPDSQPPTPEYNLRRNVNLNLPVTTTKSETSNYDRSTPLTSTNTYKSSHSQPSHTLDQSLLNVPNLPQIMERYAKDERMLSSYTPTSMSSAYQDKNMSLMFPKNMNSVHSAMASSQMYQPASVPKPYGRTDNPYSQSPQPTHNWPSEPISLESDKKAKSRKKKTTSIASTPPSTSSPSYNYSTPKPSSLPSNDPAMSLKPPNMLAGSAFNFGAPGSLASSLYGDSSYFLDPSTNQYMAANYITAHQRSTPEVDKGGKPAHSSTPFQFLSPQVRPGYPLVGMESPSIYQQYIQRQQEEFLRPLHSQIMGMFPPGYNPSLGGRQPFDSIPRPWL